MANVSADAAALPTLPTLDKLNATVPETASAPDIAQDWLTAFSEAKSPTDIQDLFLKDSFWRDILALTSDIRSLHGWNKIKLLLDARLSHIAHPRLLKDTHNQAAITPVFPDLTLLLFTFGFDTPIGEATGIVRLVPCGDGKWRAWVVFTALDSLKNSVEKVCGAHSFT